MIQRISTPEVEAAVKALAEAGDAVYGHPMSELHKNEHKHLDWPVVAFHYQTYLQDEVYDLIASLCGPDDYVQRKPNLRIHLPGGETAIPFHSDVLYGHSPHEKNYWLTLTPAFGRKSMWMVDDKYTESLHASLRDGMSLEGFQNIAGSHAQPIVAETPGLYTFCCSQIHGSMKNTTDSTRVSFDMRTIPCDAPVGVKRRGSYFKPKWLKNGWGQSSFPHIPTAIPTVATLDYATPVYLQRQVMQNFRNMPPLTELVEFHGLKGHAPTLEAAMTCGPVVAYTVRQLRRMVTLMHPIGFADESTWFLPGDEAKLERFWRECR